MTNLKFTTTVCSMFQVYACLPYGSI